MLEQKLGLSSHLHLMTINIMIFDTPVSCLKAFLTLQTGALMGTKTYNLLKMQENSFFEMWSGKKAMKTLNLGGFHDR